jgi:hypothetical protein
MSTASITFGDSLGVPESRLTTYACGAPCTISTTVSPARLAYFRSPITGTIVRWRIETNAESAPQMIRFRVLAPTAMDPFTGAEDEKFSGAASSKAVPVPTTAGTFTFPTRLPVIAGDFIGLDTEGKALGAVAVEEESIREFAKPPLRNRSAPRTGIHEDYALLINADVVPPTPHVRRRRHTRHLRHKSAIAAERAIASERRAAPWVSLDRLWSLGSTLPAQTPLGALRKLVQQLP